MLNHRKPLRFLATFGVVILTAAVAAQETVQTPAQGYNIHVLAPHRHEDGTVAALITTTVSRSNPRSCSA